MPPDVVDRADVRVAQRSDDARFTLESRLAVRIAGHRRGQDFDGDIAPEPRVTGTIDLAHAARSDWTADLVGSETCSRTERHRGSCDGRLKKESGWWADRILLWEPLRPGHSRPVVRDPVVRNRIADCGPPSRCSQGGRSDG